jgi:hypothetical protein
MEFLRTLIELAAPCSWGGWLLVVLVVVFKGASKENPRAARFIEYVGNTDHPDRELTNSRHRYA